MRGDGWLVALLIAILMLAIVSFAALVLVLA